MAENKDEIWKDVYGYEGLYEVSSIGRVRSRLRTVKRKDGFTQTHNATMLVQTIGSHGYPAVALCKDGIPLTHTVHSLVARAFLGERPQGHEIRHADGVRANAVLTNLSYCTNKENQADRKTHGTHNFGERNPMAKLKSSDVESIREKIGCGENLHEIAAVFGVSWAAISDIAKGRRWTGP